MTKVKKSFSTTDYTDLELLQKAKHVHSKMEGNSNFATPSPTLAELDAAITKFDTSMNNQRRGMPETTAYKNQCRKELATLLAKLAKYVEDVAAGDDSIALSSGFDLYQKPTTPGQLPIPQNITAKASEKGGSVILKWDKIDNAYSYLIKYYEEGTLSDTAKIASCTSANIEIPDLISGKKYNFMVAGVGSDPSRNWCKPVSTFVL
jgi:hypothetical protein